MDRERLDYARVLISKTSLEVVNSSSEVVIDGCNYVIKLVEEWGCNLGEDTFLSEEESESKMEAIIKNASVLEEINGDMNELVDDLNEEWLNGVDINAEISNNATEASLKEHCNDMDKLSNGSLEAVQQGLEPKANSCGFLFLFEGSTT